MRKHIAVLLILVALLSVSVYGYMTYVEPRAHGDSTILSLNTSADIEQVGISDYHKKVIKNGSHTEAEITASQINDAYTKMLKDIYGDADIKVNVYGPYKYNNAKAVYGVEAVVETDNYVEYVFMIVDANKLPASGVDTIYAVIYCHMDKTDDVQAKLSKEDILKLAKQEYAKHKTPQSNDSYDISLFLSQNKSVYDVNVNDEVMIAAYDGDTGELLDLFIEENETAIHTQDECRQLAQSRLDENDCNYSQYLSLGEAIEETENDSTNYTYDIIYENGDDKQVIGSIKVNANNLSVISFDIHEPEVEDNGTDDTSYEDNPNIYGVDEPQQTNSRPQYPDNPYSSPTEEPTQEDEYY